MKYNIDLHIHSNASIDGSFEPKEIIDMACREEMQAISITDHNSCKGVIQALEYQKTNKTNLKIITGIEMDCNYQGYNLHVLGYGINPFDNIFEEIEAYICTIEQKAGIKRVRLIEDYFNIKLNTESLLSKSTNGVVTGEVIADELLSNAQYAKLDFLDVYRKNGMRSDNPLVNFYWDICAQGKVAYVPLNLPSLDKIVDVIKRTGGVAVLAHPGNNIHENSYILQGILKQGVVGIEAISSYHNKDQISFYLQKAKENRVFITCGSDFHGKTKPAIKMGEFDFIFEQNKLLYTVEKAMEEK